MQHASPGIVDFYDKEERGMMKLKLQQFAGTLTVTLNKDLAANWTAASASPASSLDEGDKVTLTLTPAEGKELDEVRVMAGGVTIYYNDDDGYHFYMGESSVTLLALAKAANCYRIVEDTNVWINGTATELKRNMKLIRHNNGAIVDVEGDGEALTIDSAVLNELIKAGAVVKIGGKQKQIAPPEAD